MQNVRIVRVIEGGGRIEEDSERLGEIQFSRQPEVPQGPALDELHHQISNFLFLSEIVNGDDVLVIQAGGRLGLDMEPFHETADFRGIGEEVKADRLKGDDAAKDRVEGAIHTSHSTPADFAINAIPPDPVHKKLKVSANYSMLICTQLRLFRNGSRTC